MSDFWQTRNLIGGVSTYWSMKGKQKAQWFSSYQKSKCIKQTRQSVMAILRNRLATAFVMLTELRCVISVSIEFDSSLELTV